MAPSSENLDGLVIGGIVAAAFVAPFALLYILFSRGKLLFKIHFLMFDNMNEQQTTPPLNKVQKEIFLKGVESYIESDKIVQSSVIIEEVKTK